ncbi:hypothetical protein Gpo141_00003355 [Globisporangium polare]
MTTKGRALVAYAALCVLLLSALTAHAWQPGSDGKAQWDFRCDFQAQDLLNQQAESVRCGDICDYVAGCTHWTWTTYLGGTCWLKHGSTNRVYTSADANCGFIAARFKVDESAGFDLGTDFSDGVTGKKDVLSVDDADSFLRVLNFYRLAYGKPKLQLDARLVLAAKELVQMCPQQEQMDAKAYSEPTKVTSAVSFGFHDGVYRLSLVLPSSVAVADALVGLGNVSDAASKPLLEAETTVIGYAARRDTTCAVSSSSTAKDPSTLTTVYSVLLAHA